MIRKWAASYWAAAREEYLNFEFSIDRSAFLMKEREMGLEKEAERDRSAYYLARSRAANNTILRLES